MRTHVLGRRSQRVDGGELWDLRVQEIDSLILNRAETAGSEYILENTSDIIVRLDQSTVVLWVSQAYTRLFGRPASDLVGQRLIASHPSGLNLLSHHLHVAGRDADASRLRLRMEDSEGRLHWVEAQFRVIRDEFDEVVELIGTLRQIDSEVVDEIEHERLDRLQSQVMNGLGVAVLLIDLNSVIQWASAEVTQILGYQPSELLDVKLGALTHHDDTLRYRRDQREANAGASRASEYRLRSSSGEFVWVYGISRTVLDPDGVPLSKVVTLIDVHDAVIQRHQLMDSEAMFRLAMINAPQAMLVISLDGRVRMVNEAATRLLGRDFAGLNATLIDQLLHPLDVADESSARDQLLSGEIGDYTSECRIIDSVGRVRWVAHAMSLIVDEDEVPVSFVSQYIDITESRVSHMQLIERAERDALTGALNRAGIHDRIRVAIEAVAHTDRTESSAVLFCDLDGFKELNDRYGHGVGDLVLKETVSRITQAVRVHDSLGRVGGDEFVVLIESLRQGSDVQAVAQKILAAVCAPLERDDLPAPRLSIGIAMVHIDDTPESVLAAADEALYRAKRAGGRQIAGPDTVA